MSNKKSFMSVSTGVAVQTSQGTYALRTPKPEVFDQELIENIRKIDEEFSLFNNNTNETLLVYLFNLALRSNDTVSYRKLIGFDAELHHEEACFWLKNTPLSILNEPFEYMSSTLSSENIPAEYMSFMLHKLGQPILPGTKLGWGHTKPFNPPAP